jgi:hypothetical protein
VTPRTANPRLFHFSAVAAGPWRVTHMLPVVGEPLAAAASLEVSATAPEGARWTLSGITSNERYVTRPEKTELAARQEGLGRPASTRAVLIPIRKNAAWWAMTQDERRAIFEETSRHIAIGMRYLPEVARRLHHCRDLAEPQPFDFLTWFEFTPQVAPAFTEMVAALRATPEWTYVDREMEIHLDLS